MPQAPVARTPLNRFVVGLYTNASGDEYTGKISKLTAIHAVVDINAE